MNMKQIISNYFGARHDSDCLALCITHLNIAVYALCYWMTQPVLPFLTSELGANAVIFGWLQTTFSFVQLIGGPIIGRVCDTKGARLALILSQGGGACGYLLLGCSHSLPVLFLSRLPTLLMHCMHAAQAFITDLSCERSRAQALGRLTLSYGLGMVAGAPLGGFLSGQIGYHGVAVAAGVISLVTLPLTLATLPPGRPLPDAKPKAGSTSSSWMNLRPVLGLLAQPVPRSLLIFKVILGVGLSMQHSMQSMMMRDKYEVSAQQLGFVQSAAGIVGVLSNTVVVGWLSSVASEQSLMTSATLVLMTGLAAITQVNQFQVMLVLLIPVMVSSSSMYTVSTAFMTRSVKSEDTGLAIGLDHASRSFCGMFAPVVGGYLYREYGFDSVNIAAAVLAGLAVTFWHLPSRASRGEPQKSV